MSGRLSSLKSKFGLMAVAGAVLAAGVTSAALAAQSQSGASPCYGKCASKTSLSLSTHKVFYGKEQNEVFSVSVASGVAGVTRTPTGTVAVKYGTTVLCKITLLNGKGSCSPAPKALPIRVKAYWIKAHYNGNSFFLPSTSPGQSLKVLRTPSVTSLSLSTHKVFYGKEQNEVFSVSVASGVAGVTRTPTGTVAVKYGTTVLCKITLLNGKGSCSPAPKALPIRVKAYWIKAHYNGNSFFLPSTSLGRSLTVVK